MNQSKDDMKKCSEDAKDATEDIPAKGGSIVDDLMFAELMRPYEKTVEAHFSGREAVVYRSVSLPAKPGDIKPRKLREYETITDAEVNYEMPSVEDLQDEERLKQLNHHLGSSVYTKEEGLRVQWQKGYSTKKTPSDKKRYKRDMGEAMVRIKIDGVKDGLLQNADEENDKGHLNFLPSSMFNLEEHIDQEYGYGGYMPFLEEDLKKLKKDEEDK